MIDFIYILLALLYFMLVLAFIVHQSHVGIIVSMGIMVAGVYIAVNGMGGVNNFLVQAFAVINIGLGAYIMLVTGLEQITEAFGENE